MRIAILHREYPPNTVFLSTSALYQRMAKALVRRGHEVHVICQSAGVPFERIEERVVVHEVGHNLKRGNAYARIDYSYHAWQKLRELLNSKSIDVVNAEYFLAEGLIYALRKREAALVLQAHAWAEGWLEANGIQGIIQRKGASHLERIAARRADRIIATSKFTYQWLAEKAGIPRHALAIVNEFVDTDRYRPVRTTIKQRLGIPDRSRMTLFVAGMEPRKGPLVLAQAIPFVLREIPEASFVFVGRDTNMAPGGGSMKSYLQRTAEAQGFKNKLVFAGVASNEDVVEAYSACDVFVYPGLLEAGGLPPLEAMSCNSPVVATATGISAELRDVSPAYLVVDPGDPKGLAAAIIQLLSLPRERLKQLSAGHRQYVEERFCFERMIDEILAVYEDATGNGP